MEMAEEEEEVAASKSTPDNEQVLNRVNLNQLSN